MALNNPWVRYFDRSYQQIKDQVLTKLGLLVPEITDHTESNLYVRLLSIWSGIAEMLGYTIDNAGREAHLVTCRLYWSGVKHAMAVDYRIHSPIPSTGVIKITLSAASPSLFTIPAGLVVATDEGVQFTTLNSVQVQIGDTEIEINVKQGALVSGASLGTSNGLANQQFTLPSNIADNSLNVMVNSVNWQLQDTLAFSVANSTHAIQTVSVNKIPVVKFGNGFNGLIPASGATITANYFNTVGSAGNLPAGSVTTIVGSLVLPGGLSATVTNESAFVNGADIESLESLKDKIPKSVKVNDRAVTKKDYKYVAELKPGVARAGVIYSCGKTVEVFIVPEGGGLASPTLLNDTQVWMDDRKMLTTKVLVKAAGEVHIVLGININVLPNYQQIIVKAAVSSRLQEFLSYLNQEISGTVHLSDIYQLIETTEGVDFSNLITMMPIPYAKPEGATTTALNWTKTLNVANALTYNWKIRFITSTTFDLTRDSTFLGTFSVGVLVTTPEIIFTVTTGPYVMNDQWTFVTYPSYGTVILNEPSLPVSVASDITINATGGL